MGKYMRKAKITGEVAVMEVAQSSLGVRTRARTLALQRLQKTTASTATATTAANSGNSYLELRSRRLQKPPLLVSTRESKKQQQTHKESCKESPNPKTSSVNSLSCSNHEDKHSARDATTMTVGKEEETQDNNNEVGTEASFGENFSEFEGRDRSTRESTPCSLIRNSDSIRTPGSSTRPSNSATTNRRIQSAIRRNIPTTHEMEEFFAVAEQQQQRLFSEKYNFDPVNDMPLPGRYEWVRMDP